VTAEPGRPSQPTATPAVTVLIAAYNAEPFLARAVESAARQTLPPHEILIVDDASSDGTRDLARALAERFPAVRLIAADVNGGPARARNLGFAAATGDWIAVLDADDAYEPTRLADLMALADDADILADNFVYYDPVEDAVSGPVAAETPAVQWIDRYAYVSHAQPYGEEIDWGLFKPIFRRAFLEAHGLRYPQDARHGEDFLLMMDALLSGGRFRLSRKAGYRYTHRRHGWSRTRVDYAGHADQSSALLEDPRVRSDERLKSLIRRRLVAVRRLHAHVTTVGLITEKRYAELLSASARDSMMRWAALQALGRLFDPRRRIRALRRA
jgi:succinoglycan biosynthesis protein ExoO